MSVEERNILADYVLALDSADSMQACFDALSRATEALGFDAVLYASVALGVKPLEDLGPLFFSSCGYSQSFLQHYQEENLAADDFTIKRIGEGKMDTLDWWQQSRSGQLLAAEQKVIDIGRYDYGVTNGFSIPLLSNQHHLAGASVISEEADDRFAKLARERLGLQQMMVRMFHDRVYGNIEFRKALYLPLLEQLTERERQVLRLTAQGLPLKQIQQQCNMTPSYAGNVKANLLQKLGVSNGAELSYIAGAHQILEMI